MATIRLKGLDGLQKQLKKLGKELKDIEAVNKKVANKVGKRAISDMKKLIARGKSPIKGKGGFPAYKNPSRYPGGLKRARPVNLRLTGEFLRSLKVNIELNRRGYVSRIGFFDPKSIKKEEGHRKGANRQPKRPVIPNRKQTFVRDILENASEAYELAVEEALEKLAKKKF